MTKSDHLQAAATKLAEADHHLDAAKLGEDDEMPLYEALVHTSAARAYLHDLIGQRKRAGIDDAGGGP